MHKIVWRFPENPEKYVRDVLAKEADDIPVEKINAGKWVYEEISIDQIKVDEEMITSHDQDPLHIKRRDGFIKSIQNGREIFPLIVLGKELFLVDGYARYRALKYIGVQSVEVVMQKFE